MIVEIIDFSDDYKGIALVNNKKCFVTNTVVGDVVDIKITEEKSKFMSAEVVNYIKKSDNRENATFCKYFDKCGGCSLYYCKNKYYYDIKKKKLINNIKRSGYNYNENELNIFSVEFGERRRINLKYNKGIYGFYEKNSNSIVEIDKCINVSENINKAIKLLKNLRFQNLNSVDIFEASNCVSLALIFEGEPKIEEFKQLDVFKNQNFVISYGYKDKEKFISIVGEDIKLNLNGIEIILPQNCFLQATEKSQNFMIKTILEEQKTDVNTNKIADLYCGIGTYSFPLSTIKNSKIYSFEGNPSMVENMKKNIKLNNIKNVFPENKDLFNQPLTKDELNEFNAVIINPPRNGAENQCKNIVKSDIKKVIYVSCNPRSLARDLKLFCNVGFTLNKVILIDQFYLSEHIESIVVLEKNI